MTSFQDNFSRQSSIYLKYRPTYPDELFDYLSSLCNEHTLAWDCGTGNGQAATSLTKYFDHVFASDPSQAQINNAIRHPKIKYAVEVAESSSLLNKSADLLTVANA